MHALSNFLHALSDFGKQLSLSRDIAIRKLMNFWFFENKTPPYLPRMYRWDQHILAFWVFHQYKLAFERFLRPCLQKCGPFKMESLYTFIYHNRCYSLLYTILHSTTEYCRHGEKNLALIRIANCIRGLIALSVCTEAKNCQCL